MNANLLGLVTTLLALFIGNELRAQIVWEQVSPMARQSLAMAGDPTRSRVVMFGGRSTIDPGLPLGDTWEWGGNSWLLRHPTTSPGARFGHAMVWDAARGVVVLFGGYDGRHLGDTWEWDGVVWTQRTVVAGPEPRARHCLAFDASRGVVVLFGGESSSLGALGDTWEWDGTVWLRRSPGASPPSRMRHAMAYDAVGQRTIMLGGFNSSGSHYDSWSWDGATWQQRAAPFAQSLIGASMVFDPVRARIVVSGGTTTGITWEWDGLVWSWLVLSNCPRGRTLHGMAWDAGLRRVIMFGGFQYNATEADTWAWDGSLWTAVGLRHRHMSSIAYDSARSGVVMFGGSALRGCPTPATSDETWLLDKGQWTMLTPTQSPPARDSHAMATDHARGKVVLFGGRTQVFNGVALADTWEWDSVTWTQRTSLHTPPARTMHALAYHELSGKTLLFGGVSASGTNKLDDTWEWDGLDWSQASQSVSPEARDFHALAYDALRGRVVLFGGRDASGLDLVDTWEWDGTLWTRRTPTTSPSRRHDHAMTYDEGRGRVVLYGGSQGAVTSSLTDTWEWDGSNWLLRSPVGHPDSSFMSDAVYDRSEQRVILQHATTWSYRPTTLSKATSIGTGCTGSRGVPTLVAHGAPIVGTETFSLQLASARVLSPAIVALGYPSTGALLPGGCNLYAAAPLIELVAITSVAGAVDVSIPIPNDAALSGGVVHAQGFVLDPKGAFANLASLTAGLRITIGD